MDALIKLQMDEVGQRYEHCFECLEDARDWFTQFDGIVGVGVGPKERANKIYPDEPSIIVYVKEKKLRTNLRATDLVPKLFYGATTDVVEVGSRNLAVHNDFDARWVNWAEMK